MNHSVKNGIPGTYVCVETDCGKEFEITEEDLHRCSVNGWKPPLRCSTCRHKRRPKVH